MIDPERIAVAADFTDTDRVLALADALRPLGLRWLKVGLSAFITSGPALVHRLRDRGARVFLDLKLHDIPHQVGLATVAAAAHGAELLTVHASGGPEMMRAAADARGHARVVAVTVLTSLDASGDAVVYAARQAASAGLDGVVCSPLEVAAVREALGPHAFLVTPGIRPGAHADDQRRTATPAAALAAGADLLVIGRPITDAEDPVAAARAILGS